MLLRIKKVFLSKSRQSLHTNSGWFYKLALMDFGLIWGIPTFGVTCSISPKLICNLLSVYAWIFFHKHGIHRGTDIDFGVL